MPRFEQLQLLRKQFVQNPQLTQGFVLERVHLQFVKQYVDLPQITLQSHEQSIVHSPEFLSGRCTDFDESSPFFMKFLEVGLEFERNLGTLSVKLVYQGFAL